MLYSSTVIETDDSETTGWPGSKNEKTIEYDAKMEMDIRTQQEQKDRQVSICDETNMNF